MKFIIVIFLSLGVLHSSAQDQASKQKAGSTFFECELSVKADSAEMYQKLQKIKGFSELKFDKKKQIANIIFSDSAAIQEILGSVYFKACLEKLPEQKNDILEVSSQNKEQFSENQKINILLDLKDVSILNEKFVDLEPKQIDELHPRNKNYYLLIKRIHDLKILLKEISLMPFGQKSIARIKIAKAKGIIDEANKTNITTINFLSIEQKNFFGDLVNQYNLLYKEIYE